MKEEIVRKLNLLQKDIIQKAYMEEWDGDDIANNRHILRKVCLGLAEDEIETLLEEIDAIIELVKESE